MRMTRLAAIGLIFLLCSCALPPTVLPPAIEAVTAEELLGLLQQREEADTSLRGLAQISWREGKGNALRSRQALLIRKPGRIRSELFGLFGQPVLVATVNEREISALDLSAGVFYRGVASAENIYRLLHLPLAADDLVRLALNQAPPGNFPDPPLAVATAQGYQLTRANRQWRQELHFSPERHLTKVVLYYRGDRQVEAEYADFTGGDGAFPLQMRLFLPLRQVEVTIRFTTLETNVALADDLFQLRNPGGFRVQPLP